MTKKERNARYAKTRPMQVAVVPEQETVSEGRYVRSYWMRLRRVFSR